MEETGEKNCSPIVKGSMLFWGKRGVIEGIFIKTASQSDWPFENIILPDCEKLREARCQADTRRQFPEPRKEKAKLT